MVVCCEQAKWKREEIPDHKFDYIDVDEFIDDSFSYKLKYAFLFLLTLKWLLIYVVDIVIMCFLFATNSFSDTKNCRTVPEEQINTRLTCAHSLDTEKILPSTIRPFIILITILISLILLFIDCRNAQTVIRSRDISYAYTTPIAYRWKRLILAEFPRQLIFSLNLRDVVTSLSKNRNVIMQIVEAYRQIAQSKPTVEIGDLLRRQSRKRTEEARRAEFKEYERKRLALANGIDENVESELGSAAPPLGMTQRPTLPDIDVDLDVPLTTSSPSLSTFQASIYSSGPRYPSSHRGQPYFCYPHNLADASGDFGTGSKYSFPRSNTSNSPHPSMMRELAPGTPPLVPGVLLDRLPQAPSLGTSPYLGPNTMHSPPHPPHYGGYLHLYSGGRVQQPPPPLVTTLDRRPTPSPPPMYPPSFVPSSGDVDEHGRRVWHRTPSPGSW
ncbi:hypothetical protein HDU67_004957 [Dinochytrium kinnereticum]|nr:hypothetical protein HDU67_004957 [Dinochytrium kinnereticum]